MIIGTEPDKTEIKVIAIKTGTGEGISRQGIHGSYEEMCLRTPDMRNQVDA
jgi:hypothetical protein